MRKTAPTLWLVLMAATVVAQGAKPNLSGTWTLDLSKSDFGGVPTPTAMVLTIDHKEPTLKIKSEQKSEMGDVANERTLTTDGKPNTNKIRAGQGDQMVTSTTKWDGQKLVSTYTMDIGVSADFVDTWELSSDGKVLTVLRDIKAGADAIAIKTVFTKKTPAP